MASGAGRRNILRELTTIDSGGTTSPNTSLPLTPPSPDESLIQLRGLQRKSATYNYDAPDPVFFKTPTKSPKKTAPLERLTPPTRSSPRKKLNLNSPEKNINDKPVIKRKLRLQNMNHSVHSATHLKALSHAQLVNLLGDLLKATPSVKETLMSLAPKPQLWPVEERLKVLQHNVLKSLPRNIWGNEDGSFSFLRVRAHLEAYKKECWAFARQFMESQHWPTVFQYILFAWKLSLGLPEWPTYNYNIIKKGCIKFLAASCLNALAESGIDEISLNEIIERLEELGNDDDAIACVTYAKQLLKKIKSGKI